MNPIVPRWKARVIAAAVLLSGGLATNQPHFAASPESATCATPDYRQFDFWVGDWDAFEVNGRSKDARIRVERVLNSCVLLETYDGTNGHKGQSFSIYDASRKVWNQTWVTDRGQLLAIEGKMQGGEMVLSGADRTGDGQTREIRGTWRPVSEGVRETGEISTDSGRTWKPWFDLLLRPHQVNSASSADSAKEVAALDKEYQQAVKENDAASMDRILADDFILVGRTGNTQTKADLLHEARSGRIRYEHQEDSEQTVRVWGDTAIVTAKLWAKGAQDGKPFDYTLWFSDTYLRTPAGWRYIFAQAASRLPPPDLP